MASESSRRRVSGRAKKKKKKSAIGLRPQQGGQLTDLIFNLLECFFAALKFGMGSGVDGPDLR